MEDIDIVIPLPKQFDTSSMLSFFEKVIDKEKKPLHNSVMFDFCTLDYIKPTGVTALANISIFLVSAGCKVFYRWPEELSYKKNCPIKYLDDAGYFEIFIKRKIGPSPRRRSTTFPLNSIRVASYPGWLDNNVVPWLDIQLGIKTKSQFPEFIVCIQEIFNNIIDHSLVEIGTVFMQHYPALHTVEIAISDFGVGIPFNVRKILPQADDKSAILSAIKEGFSTKSHPGNRGAGLDTLIQNVVRHNRGNLSIHSYFGELFCALQGEEIGFRSRRTDGFYYPGTLLAIRLKTDTIPGPEGLEEEFSWTS